MCGYECGEATKSTRKKNQPAERIRKNGPMSNVCDAYERHHRGHIGRHRQVDERSSILKIKKKIEKKSVSDCFISYTYPSLSLVMRSISILKG